MVEETSIDKKQASITACIFASMITSFIIFGLMMSLIIDPMIEETQTKIDAIISNDDSGDIRDLSEILTKEINSLKEQIKNIKNNNGHWNCTKYKRYFDYDCQNVTGSKDSALINNITCVTVSFDNVTTYRVGKEIIKMPNINYTSLPEVCEDWEYVKGEI